MKWNNQRCCCGGRPAWPRYCVTFGVGLALSFIFPAGFIMFILAVLLVTLGVALLKQC